MNVACELLQTLNHNRLGVVRYFKQMEVALVGIGDCLFKCGAQWGTGDRGQGGAVHTFGNKPWDENEHSPHCTQMCLMV